MPTKILAIDDSKTMRLAIKITFAAEDAEVTAVSKGSEAIARAKQLAADLVIVDANLAAGEPSGYDVCQQLKADPETAKIPVLLLVSGQTGVDAARLKSCGAAGFLAKPFETQELIDKVAEATGGSRGEGIAAAAPVAAASAPAAAAPVAAAPVAAPAAQAPAAPPAAQAPAAQAPAAQAPAAPAAAAPPPRIAAPPVAAAQPVPATPAAPPSGRTVPLVGAPTPGARPPVTSPAAAPPPSSPERSAPTAQGPVRPQPAVRPVAAAPAAAASDGPIPIAIPIPFTAASDPTPGMLARLRERSGAAAGLDPKVAEAIVALSREVLEAIAWEVVPDLAEKIVRARADANAG